MAVVIRLRKMGHKKAPYFRIVVTDKRCARDGSFIETVGTYHPLLTGDKIVESVKTDRVEYWLSKGAKPSDTVWSILKRSGMKKPCMNKPGREAPVKEESAAKEKPEKKKKAAKKSAKPKA